MCLIQNILEGKTVPTVGVDAIVWVEGDNLEIFVDSLIGTEQEPDEIVSFFWNYDEKKALMVRSADFNKGCLILKADPMLFLQMRYLGYEGMRVAIAYRCGDTIVCGYIRNTAAQEEELAAEERQIGKLSENAGTAFVAYWTEGGILSLRFRSAKKFNDVYYRLRLTGYQWDGEQLLLYVETPLVEGKPQFDLYSLTTGEVCREAQINLKTEWNNRLHRVMKLALDFSGIRLKNVDGYRLLCNLDGLQYQLYMAAEISETDEKIEFVTNSAESFVLCIAQNTTGRFLLQIQNEAYPVMLSVVTAVYNTEPFLAEMIDSVLMQDTKGLERYLIGNETGNFQKKKYRHLYELILVDDGSTDGSADILDDYARLSDSIRVIHKENGGVSSARNAGMEVARGKYINFADSDDKLSKNFFSESLSFFEEHEDEIDITTAPLKFFDKKTEAHWANYKFKSENHVIDLLKTPDAVVFHVNSSIFKSSDLHEKYFDTDLINGEDIVFVHEILRDGYKKLEL